MGMNHLVMAALGRIPPNGFHGHAQQTTAAQVTHANFGGRGRSTAPKRRRRSAAARPSVPRPPKRAKKASRVVKMRKGSAAAKAWGRKMARMRKRRR